MPVVQALQEVQVEAVVLCTQEVQEGQEVQECAPHVVAQLLGIAGCQPEKSMVSRAPLLRFRFCHR